MKKWIGVVFALLILLLAGIYLFIPNNLRLHTSVQVHAPANGVLRQLKQPAHWQRWWPGQRLSANSSTDTAATQPVLILRGASFRVVDQQFSGMTIGISTGSDTAFTQLIHATPKPDTLNISWDAAVNTGINPLTRFNRYRAARNIAAAMQEALDSMKHYYEVQSNTYELEIHDEALFDSVLVFTETESFSKPDNQIIYPMIERLRRHIAASGAQERNDPMMSYFRIPGGPYSIRVAIPIDRPVSGSGTIVQKNMPPRVRIFTAEVKGGQNAADSGMSRMDQFVKDQFLNAAGGPFFILKTDRLRQPDSSRWITRIVYPVM